MGTIILQSYRAEEVPWIRRCLRSVERWATESGHAYRFVGDELFDLLPQRYRARTQHSKLLMADLARLILIRDALAEGYDHAVWFDADVLVVDPGLALPAAGDYFCRELWVEPVGAGIVVDERVNNCVCGFHAGSELLPFYIEACQQIVRDAAGAIATAAVGTEFLSTLDRPFHRLDRVALWSPFVLRDVAAGGGPCLDALRARSGPPAAINLCASFRGKTVRVPGAASIFVDDALFDQAITRVDRDSRDSRTGA